MKYYTIQLLAFIMFLVSCRGDKGSGPIQTIDLTGPVSKEIFKLSDIATDIEYIPLETTPDCYIKQIMSFSVTDRYILVYDHWINKIFLFDRHGKFLRPISRFGKGPGEYTYPNQVAFSKDHQSILILNAPYIHEFSPQGEFRNSTRLDPMPSGFTDLGERLLLLYGYPNNLKNQGYSFNLTDLTGKIQKQFFHISGSKFNTNANLSIIGPYNFQDTLSFFTRRMDTIYGIAPDFNIRPRYTFKQNNWSVEDQVPGQPERLSPALSVLLFREIDDYFMIMGLKYDRIQNYVYSKKDQTIWRIKGAGIPNDIDGGPDIWPDRATPDYLYNIEPPWTFLNSGKDSLRVVLPCRYPKKRDAYNQFVSTLAEDSNPVLVIVKLK